MGRQIKGSNTETKGKGWAKWKKDPSDPVPVRKLKVEDLPKAPPVVRKFYVEKVVKVGTIRKKSESMKSFHVRTLKKLYREHCMKTTKDCSVDSVNELCDSLKGKDVSETYGHTIYYGGSDVKRTRDLTKESIKEARQKEILCRICPSQKASDDVWIKWGEYYGFKFELNDTKKKGTITIIKEKAKAKVKAKVEKKVEATPIPPVPGPGKSAAAKKEWEEWNKKYGDKSKPTPKPKPKPTPKPKPKPTPKPKPKPKPKKIVKKATKPATTKPKKTLKGTKLTAKQKKHLKDQGYVNITHNKKKYRITPSRVKRGTLLR